MPTTNSPTRKTTSTGNPEIRHDWSLAEIEALFALPFNDLLFRAQQVHRTHFDANSVQISTPLSIKTGACPEDCKYCPQSGHYTTGLDKEKLLKIEQGVTQAKADQHARSKRLLLGESWIREPATDSAVVSD